ncbi:hypothetical protein TNCV_3386151 [Trichonephila clavipes]|nr:hypothetical protein TNCV_3386151 [Trichonephila clavipes]
MTSEIGEGLNLRKAAREWEDQRSGHDDWKKGLWGSRTLPGKKRSNPKPKNMTKGLWDEIVGTSGIDSHKLGFANEGLSRLSGRQNPSCKHRVETTTTTQKKYGGNIYHTPCLLSEEN